jgi:transposase
VLEVSPQRTAQYRRRGRTQDKTDPADALAIARLLLAEGAHLPPVQRDDLGTELRVLSDHRDNLVVERTRLINQLHAQMLQLDPQYQERGGALTTAAGRVHCRTFAAPLASSLAQTRVLIVQQLVDQLEHLEAAIATRTKELKQRVAASQTPVRGVGVVVAARLLGELGSTPRVHSAGALAALAGIAPIAVSSGGRHSYRVNPGGNRQLNRAIPIIALTQRRCEPRARTYYEKKRAEGKTKRAAMRCLKRRLVDVIFRLLQQHPAHRAAAA